MLTVLMWLRQTYPAHLVRRLLILSVTGGLLLALFIGWASRAEASPGQCSSGYYRLSGGGYCDGPARADGTWYHCERIVIGGWGGQNCFDVRPVPVEIDPRGWTPVR
mgnify:CR=1 FL=1